MIVRNRLVAALVENASLELPLVRVEAHGASFGVAATGAPLAVISHRGEPLVEFASRLVALMEAQSSTVYLVIVGGDPRMPEFFADLVARAPDLRSLGLYHLTAEGQLVHIDGRHLGALESAAKKLPEIPPLSAAELEVIVADAQRKHIEAVQFTQQTRRRFPVVSLVLGGLCVLLFFRFGAADGGSAVSMAGANIGSLVKEGQVWRWLSSLFLHGSQSHLLMNMLSLYFVGTFLEQVVGRARYLLIYGLSGLGASMASSLIGADVWSVGASGAIWGVMAAGYGLALRPSGILPPVVASRIKRGLSTPLLINIGISFLPGIDLRAHFGGGAVGLLLALSGVLGNSSATMQKVQGEPQEMKSVPTPKWVTGAAVLVGGLMVAALVIALQHTLALLAAPAEALPPNAVQ
jgi:rhomboid protease GluP